MKNIKDVMTTQAFTLEASSPITEAARIMSERDVGDVLVTKHGELCGIVTDRDIVVRALAKGKDLETSVGEICSMKLTTLSPNDSVDKAVELMRENAVRRLPIVEDGKPVGMVSLGDLAMDRDPRSALADISAAPPNNDD
ncbi:MAG TPA: CBS domain-containing protein [Actinomycetota bacterium]|nr:CBS domain-containing protein [Actinomycetota bacterium]